MAKAMKKEKVLKKKNFERARVEIRGAKDRPWGIRFVSGESVRYVEIEKGETPKLAAMFEAALEKAGVKFQAFTESVFPEYEDE